MKSKSKRKNTAHKPSTKLKLNSFKKVEQAIEDFRNGRFVIVVDDEHRENEGDFIIAAEKVTPEAINFMARFGRGLICMPLAEEIIARLQIPMMVEQNKSKQGTGFTVSIGAKEGITTGISAHDRARTVQVVVDPYSMPEDIVSPGHMFPLRAAPGGVLARTGHTEAGVDLARLAGLRPAAVICEIMNDDGSMARQSELEKVAKEHGLTLLSIADIVAYRMHHESVVHECVSALLPLKSYGTFHMKVFENRLDGSQHIAMVCGDIDPDKPCLVRLHSQCATGDIFGSARCDCGWQLEYSMSKIGAEGGVLLYLNQEGRGIGLVNKLKAYTLQDTGMDTVEANHELGFSADLRDYSMAAEMLNQLGVKKIRLLTNNPRKLKAVEQYGIEIVAREPIETEPSQHNKAYLRTKRKKLGHMLSLVDE